MLSDKGKQTLVCYANTYNALVEGHFNNTSLYKPVEETDTPGYKLDSMIAELTHKISDIANRADDREIKRLIMSFVPTKDSKFPEGRVNLKTHKPGITNTQIPVRPIISNTKSPTSKLAGFLGKCLTNNLGVISNKHVSSVEQFAERVKTYPTNGRLLSLDVENLFTAIPVNKVISFLRDMSGGWGLNPPPTARPVNPPIYSFEIDSELFCDLVELCLSFNQFKVNGNFYRQIQGLFMGSSISPPLAMTYMEHFEKHIYEIQMPIEIKATVWDRYVDDYFLIYEHRF